MRLDVAEPLSKNTRPKEGGCGERRSMIRTGLRGTRRREEEESKRNGAKKDDDDKWKNGRDESSEWERKNGKENVRRVREGGALEDEKEEPRIRDNGEDAGKKGWWKRTRNVKQTTKPLSLFRCESHDWCSFECNRICNLKCAIGAWFILVVLPIFWGSSSVYFSCLGPCQCPQGHWRSATQKTFHIKHMTASQKLFGAWQLLDRYIRLTMFVPYSWEKIANSGPLLVCRRMGCLKRTCLQDAWKPNFEINSFFLTRQVASSSKEPVNFLAWKCFHCVLCQFHKIIFKLTAKMASTRKRSRAWRGGSPHTSGTLPNRGCFG